MSVGVKSSRARPKRSPRYRAEIERTTKLIKTAGIREE